jgi:FtsP/CotA-like multicopper oxidase with cupredoxin domain
MCCGTAAAAENALAKLRPMQLPPQLQERGDPVSRAANARDKFEKSYDLFIRYTEGAIYNPTTATYDKVNLRAYQQKTDQTWDPQKSNASRFQAPTVVMAPGQTVRFRLYNQLPELSATKCASTDINTPNPPECFNTTNLHSHGLWVSPSGNSDNVLLSIQPNVGFEYEYNIPFDHPAGTFWYHPHQHGSTAIQVASGMAGALIVEGDRYPTRDANGDLDTLLKKFRPAAGSNGEVMMLQQIPYSCQAPGNPVNWDCATSAIKTGTVEDFAQVGPPTAWKMSGRYTTVNGQVQPVLQLKEQQLYRWRLIDSGFQSTVVLRIRGSKDPAKLEAYLQRPNSGEDVEKLCDGGDVTQFEVATDGLTHGKVISKISNYLQPGYRSDILFALPKGGEQAYCIFDDKGKDDLNQNAKNTRLLGVIRVEPNLNPPKHTGDDHSQAGFIRQELIAAAAGMPADIRQTIIDGLNDGLSLGKFVPHRSFSDEDLAKMNAAKKEYVTFNIARMGGKVRFMVEGKLQSTAAPDVKNIYQPGRIDHTVILGEQQLWELQSRVDSHPFHIHVNPFQIVSITHNDKDKQKEPLPPQYRDLVGTWKDTVLVMEDYKVVVATRYERYIGEFVLHCHILEHEDQGMMQNVKVVLPDGQGGASAGGHGAHH